MRLILASSSFRRLQLLQLIGYQPDLVVAPDIDETPYHREKPAAHVLRLALGKATRVAEQFPEDVILAADTIVYCQAKIIGKPGDAQQAAACLRMLSGRRHRTYTGVCVRQGDKILSRVAHTIVSFKRLHDDEIVRFVESEAWVGKAGGYSISGPAAAFITHINGMDSNVAGLPLPIVYNLLQNFALLPKF